MKMRILKTALSGICLAAMLMAAGSAKAISVDQIIYQSGSPTLDPSQFSGTVSMTFSGGVLTILLKNTSGNGAADAKSAILSGMGFELPSGMNIDTSVPGSVKVGPTSSGVNFTAPAGTDISANWNYANTATDGYLDAGVLAVGHVVSSVDNGQNTRFAGPPPVTLDGPDYGAVSANETGLGNNNKAVLNELEITLNLTGSYSGDLLGFIDSHNVVIAFGSPNTPVSQTPDGGSTIALLGFALLGIGALRNKLSRN